MKDTQFCSGRVEAALKKINDKFTDKDTGYAEFRKSMRDKTGALDLALHKI
jgi:hypothetical protein